MSRNKIIKAMGKKTVELLPEVIIGPKLLDVTAKSNFIKETNVPIKYIAKELGMSQASLRELIREGVFQFATYRIVNDRSFFYCSSKLLFEQRGIIYNA